MKTLRSVAKRLSAEVGLSHATSLRVAKKLNTLAKSVDWATPVSYGNFFVKRKTVSRKRSRSTGRKLTSSGR